MPNLSFKSFSGVMPPPVPKISGGYKFFLEGETLSMNCTVNYENGLLVSLNWEYPPNVSNVSNNQ